MTSIIPIFVWLYNHLWVVAFFIVLTYFSLVLYQKYISRHQPDKPNFPAALILLLLPLLLFFYRQGFSEINAIEKINYSPVSNKVIAVITYDKVNGMSTDAVISLSLDEQKIDYFYSFDGFERVPGYAQAQDAIYIHDWSEDRLKAISLEYFKQVTLPKELAKNENYSISYPILIGDYLFNDGFPHTFDTGYSLATMERIVLPDDMLSDILDYNQWSVFSNTQKNERIEKILAMETKNDYRQFFLDVLDDESMASEHSRADSGLYFIENDYDRTYFSNLRNVFLREGLQKDFIEKAPSMTNHEIIGIEDNGIVYSLGLQDGQTVVLKQETDQHLTQERIQLPLEDFEFASTHLEDRFYIMTKQGLFELMKDDFKLNAIIDFEDIL